MYDCQERLQATLGMTRKRHPEVSLTDPFGVGVMGSTVISLPQSV